MKDTTEKKLAWLLELQNIDKQLDEIAKIQGDLPDEVKGLEDELASIQVQLQKDQDDIAGLSQTITTQRVKIKDSEKLVQRYEEQQMNVRNNREYDAITKEIELQRLDIQLAEKEIKTCYGQIEKKKITIAQSNTAIKKKQQALTDKQEELQAVVKESQEEASNLHEQRAKLIKKLDKDLLQSYERIRKNAHNNRAVVVIKRGACSGCFTTIHLQMQAEVREKKELASCEHCGRIIADVVDPLITEEENTIEIEEPLSIDS